MANTRISFDQLKVGQEYNRTYLAKLWNYDGTEGLSRGIIHPKGSNIIILFTTEEKDKYSTQYQDRYADGILTIEGQE